MSVNIKKFPGTPLKEADFKENKVLYNRWRPKLEYAWDAGVAIGRYLAELKKEHLIGIRCPECRRVMVPPRVVCEWCFRPLNEWVYLEDTGTVNTFSLCYVTWDMRRVKEPEIPAVIEIDGASPGHGIMHRLGEIDPQEVKIGMRVKAVWKPEDERTGAITDIKYFKPLE